MNIKVKYILLVFTLHTVLTFLTFKLLEDKKVLFILSEIFILFSLYLSYSIYQSFIRPIDLMKSGTNAIKDGDFNIKYLKTNSTDVNYLINTFNEMIDRLRTEKLRTIEQSYLLENLIEASPIGIVILDFDNKISVINPTAKSYLRINNSPLGKSLEDLPSPLSHHISTLNIGQKEIFEFQGIDKFRTQAESIIHKGFKRKFIIIEELSEEILEAEKKAYGKVIRMMAHEVNNSIGAINSILNTTKEFGFKGNSEAGEWQEALQVAIDRNDRLNSFMKNFAKVIKLPQLAIAPTNLNELTKRVVGIISDYALEKSVKIHYHPSIVEATILADEIQLEQVIVNIIKNSIESIENNGNIYISTFAKPKRIVIEDDGHGISEESSKQIFTPFFSTKMDGQGIGLMLIKEILLKHKATFSLQTSPESKRTAFEITF